jgi:hypothetical protein
MRIVKLEAEIAVVVPSCDSYSDLWPPFFDLFARFWPDCPFPVYLISNRRGFSRAGVENLLVGDDVSWSDNLMRALSKVDAEYVLLLIDDLLLVKPVNTCELLNVLDEFVKSGGNYLRLNPKPKPDRFWSKRLGIVSKGTIYRTATVSSVWKRQTLLELLVSGETAWDFELLATVRSDVYDGFYATHVRYLSVVNAVIKGRWERSALSKLRRLSVQLKLGERPVMTLLEALCFQCCLLRSFGLSLFPARLRRRIKDLVPSVQYRDESSARLRPESTRMRG